VMLNQVLLKRTWHRTSSYWSSINIFQDLSNVFT
jgi:hypothetical protein